MARQTCIAPRNRRRYRGTAGSGLADSAPDNSRTVFPRKLEAQLIQRGTGKSRVQLQTDRVGKIDLVRVCAPAPLLDIEGSVRLIGMRKVVAGGKQVLRALIPVDLAQRRYCIVAARNRAVFIRIA